VTPRAPMTVGVCVGDAQTVSALRGMPLAALPFEEGFGHSRSGGA